jgi:hypothetical protein
MKNLSISIPTRFGIDGTVWQVVQTNIDWNRRTAHVVVYGWATEDTTAKPIDQRVFSYGPKDFPFDDYAAIIDTCNALIMAEAPVTAKPSEFAKAVVTDAVVPEKPVKAIPPGGESFVSVAAAEAMKKSKPAK